MKENNWSPNVLVSVYNKLTLLRNVHVCVGTKCRSVEKKQTLCLIMVLLRKQQPGRNPPDMESRWDRSVRLAATTMRESHCWHRKRPWIDGWKGKWKKGHPFHPHSIHTNASRSFVHNTMRLSNCVIMCRPNMPEKRNLLCGMINSIFNNNSMLIFLLRFWIVLLDEFVANAANQLHAWTFRTI